MSSESAPSTPPTTPESRFSRLRRLGAAILTEGLASLRRSAWIVLLAAGSLAAGVAFTWVFIAPRYSDPSTRLYSSKFGYGTVARKMRLPFPVKSHQIGRREITARVHGEGLVATEPVQVPLVAMARIDKVHAGEGDRVQKGQLLVELDSRRAVVKLDAAQAALRTALAERERTFLGSSYVLANERPEKQIIDLQTSRKMVEIQQELADMEKNLATKGAGNRRDVLLSQQVLLNTLNKLREDEWAYGVAEQGRKQSLDIADSKIDEALLAYRHRELELEEYRVFAPCDGIVERCLIHAGEYNQDPGKPAFLVNRGTWFEARLDQTTTGRVKIGDRAVVHLEAFPNESLEGRVARIAPTVSYDTGGPEATRPVRPLGSGAPEWPSTYAVRIELNEHALPVVPGLTGFARIEQGGEALAAPLAAIFARSGRSALVYVLDGEAFEPRTVTLGAIADGWAEIRGGLTSGEEILIEGHEGLEPGDSIEVTARNGEPLAERRRYASRKPAAGTGQGGRADADDKSNRSPGGAP